MELGGTERLPPLSTSKQSIGTRDEIPVQQKDLHLGGPDANTCMGLVPPAAR